MHKFSINRLQLPLLLPAIILVILGLSAFYSIDVSIFRQQLFSLVLGLLAYVLFLNIDIRIFGVFSKYIYIIMLASLILLFLIGIEARGSVRWLDLFGARIQFSEIFKPFYVIFLAQFLTKDDSKSFSKFITAFILLAPIFVLTLKQPDLGTALLFLFTTIFMLFMYGFPIVYFLIIGLCVVIPAPIIYGFLHDYQRERILTFIDPTRDPFGSSYNVVQSLISIGSGGFFGKGFGQATQSILKFLPERHTDFIFATITESLGFLGAMFMIVLYGFLLNKIYRIALTVTDSFSNMVIYGLFFLFLTQTFLNMGMNVGIVPIVGITLPFVSYGGNSLITSFIMLGIISSISFEHKSNRSLEIA
ncbi:MAG TPA: FtsW/RodA/SpoVE family cell cycle protein [Patescibacteria group bacterium]|nr:FtsW/RodA/SpoVE family cell cycle protein [Patescibacteria group bacterium]